MISFIIFRPTSSRLPKLYRQYLENVKVPMAKDQGRRKNNKQTVSTEDIKEAVHFSAIIVMISAWCCQEGFQGEKIVTSSHYLHERPRVKFMLHIDAKQKEGKAQTKKSRPTPTPRKKILNAR